MRGPRRDRGAIWATAAARLPPAESPPTARKVRSQPSSVGVGRGPHRRRVAVVEAGRERMLGREPVVDADRTDTPLSRPDAGSAVADASTRADLPAATVEEHEQWPRPVDVGPVEAGRTARRRQRSGSEVDDLGQLDRRAASPSTMRVHRGAGLGRVSAPRSRGLRDRRRRGSDVAHRGRRTWLCCRPRASSPQPGGQAEPGRRGSTRRSTRSGLESCVVRDLLEVEHRAPDRDVEQRRRSCASATCAWKVRWTPSTTTP